MFKKMKTKMIGWMSGISVGMTLAINNVAAEGLKDELVPYQKNWLNVLNDVADIGGIVMLGIALGMALFGKRKEATVTAIGTVVSYVGIRTIATIWAALTGI